MSRYLLDTNIISNVVKPKPSASLLAWLAEQPDSDLYIAALTLAEIWRGILEHPDGRRRAALESWFVGSQGPAALFAGRILVFDEQAAMVWARLMAEGRIAGRPRSAMDMMIAATAEANGCVVVTDNEKDFSGLPVLNPVR